MHPLNGGSAMLHAGELASKLNKLLMTILLVGHQKTGPDGTNLCT